MESQKLTNEQSLALIGEMIQQTKQNLSKGGSFYFLLWGWVIAIANIGHYLIDYFDWYHAPYIMWLLTIPAFIATIVYSVRSKREALITTHLDRSYYSIWIGISVTIFILIAFMPVLEYNHNPVILCLAAIGTLQSGFMIRFRPLIIGSGLLFAGAIIGFIMGGLDQYLIAGISVIVGYLIPGYMLRKFEKSE